MISKRTQLRTEWLSRKMQLRGMRITAVRSIEIEVLCEADGPLSIQQLYQRVSKRVRTDLSTVYRFVNSLLEAGLVRSIMMPSSDVLRDSLHFPGESSDFVTCVNCGKSTRLKELKELRELEKQLATELHFQGLTHEFHLSGRCEPCQQARRNVPSKQSSDS